MKNRRERIVECLRAVPAEEVVEHRELQITVLKDRHCLRDTLTVESPTSFIVSVNLATAEVHPEGVLVHD